MFSSFSNMLPNLLPGQEKDQQTPTNSNGSINPFDRLMAVKRKFDGVRTPVPQQAEAESPEEEQQEEQIKEKQRKRKPLNETFVVVRPPPSVSNHPLNLQLQLIPPSIQPQQQRSSSVSTTASASSTEGRGYSAAGGVPNVPPISAGLQSRKEAQQDDDELTRVRTNRSDLSGFYSSIGSSSSVQSFSTVASTSTSAGGTRRIIPLYNLSAHNVLQNTVLDAGTDATVSRFRKRGIDIVGLGTLEPIEVYGNLSLSGAGGYGFEDASDAGHGSNLGHGQGRPRSFLSTSAVSDNSPPSELSHTRDASAPAYLEESATPTPKENAGKKLFGRLFKKKDSPAATPTGLLSPTVGTPRALVGGPVGRGMLSPPPSARERPASIHSAVVPPTPTTPQGPYLQPPVLGTQATLRSESYPPHGRPTAYVWILRRWTKGGGVLAGLVGAGGVDMARMGVEVRFEWVKGKKRRRVQESSGQEFSPRGGRPVSVYSLADGDNLGVPLGTDGASARSVSPDPASRRSASPTKPRSTSPTKPRSQSPTKPRLVRTSSGSDDEDSDPEDSETPWSCTLRILPIEPGDLTSTTPPTEGLKLRLANLIPAPHHPKVIGQFKMPFPLPDIAVQKIELVPRLASDPFGMGSGEGGGEMVMTAEEVKDVVCTTGLWLMVREGFGGLNGKKRKGDGWKIRS